MLIRFSFLVIAAAVAVSAGSTLTFGQSKRRRQPPKATPARTVPDAPKAQAEPKPTATPSQKKNERPGTQNTAGAPVTYQPAAAKELPYRYEFAQPDFPVEKVIIEHDGAGAGTISFQKKQSDELFSDPLQISEASMARIKEAYAALDFLNSRENYQFEKDYSHLGNVTLRLKEGGRERLVTFNWTENKEARVLYDEYRKVSNQFIWVFDITVARENEPLEAPRLLRTLESLIKRKEISDPPQMTPLLRGLQDDERIPLIARNHAAKLVKEIEKIKK